MNIEELKKEAISICETCKLEIRSMTEEEETRYNEIKNSIIELRKEEEKEEETPKNEEDNTNEEVINKESDDAKKSENDDKKEEDEKRNITENNINLNLNNNNTFKMEKRFSLLQAINDIANNRNLDEAAQAVINAGREEMRHAGLSYSGQIQLPVEERAAVTVTGEGGEHDNLVVVDFKDILAPLRAKNVLVQAGAKYLSGCVGDVQVPIMTASNVGWEAEIADAKDGKGGFSNVKLSPKRLTAYIDISKQFLVQDSLSAETLIREDLVNALNAKLEATILGSAAATATQPAGIFNGATLTAISDFAGICNFEAGIEDANVIGECKYVMSPKARAKVRCMAKSSKTNELVYQANTLDGTTVLTTTHVADTNFAYGDFSNLCIAQWGNLDITVDPYTKAAAGQVRIVVNAFFDAKVLRPEAIKVAKF